ncbi:MAG: DUF615 domain-containing protein [Gammaproteobacteria bacterium]|nr:DUF615 domain-containing protein [Gammaproteobacteria bacterium]
MSRRKNRIDPAPELDSLLQSEDNRPPSKSSRKRAAHAAQELGERLVALKESHFAPLNLPENIADAIRAARNIRTHGGLARQHQYIGKLMREIDTIAIEEALTTRARITRLK